MIPNWEDELKKLAAGALKTAANGAAGALAREGRKIAKKIDKKLRNVERRATETVIDVEAEDDEDDPRYP